MGTFLTFGVLCGMTAAVFTVTAGAGPLMALAAYSAVGSLGLLAMVGASAWGEVP